MLLRVKNCCCEPLATLPITAMSDMKPPEARPAALYGGWYSNLPGRSSWQRERWRAGQNTTVGRWLRYLSHRERLCSTTTRRRGAACDTAHSIPGESLNHGKVAAVTKFSAPRQNLGLCVSAGNSAR